MSEKKSFAATLADLKGEARPPRASLQGLSDLSSRETERLKPVWERLPLDRRRWAAQALSDLAEDNIELHFAAVFKVLLFDPDPEVRQAAVEGLWESDDLAVADYLLGILNDDASDEVRAAAASALGHFAYLAEMGDLPADMAARMRAALLAAVHGQAPLDVRRRAVEAVGFISNDAEVWKVIAAAYASPEPTMRASAVFAMGRNCDARWLQDVLKEMDSDDPQMRFEAARAAGEIEDRRAVPKLLRLLVDSDT
ncbi:MAG: HEAT repeat domain-containing protein, partial [Chloroflexota bacterium]